MPIPLIAGLPPDLVLSAGYTFRVTALDPVTGNTMGGVTVKNISIFVSDIGGTLDAIPLLVPTNQAV